MMVIAMFTLFTWKDGTFSLSSLGVGVLIVIFTILAVATDRSKK